MCYFINDVVPLWNTYFAGLPSRRRRTTTPSHPPHTNLSFPFPHFLVPAPSFSASHVFSSPHVFSPPFVCGKVCPLENSIRFLSSALCTAFVELELYSPSVRALMSLSKNLVLCTVLHSCNCVDGNKEEEFKVKSAGSLVKYFQQLIKKISKKLNILCTTFEFAKTYTEGTNCLRIRSGAPDSISETPAVGCRENTRHLVWSQRTQHLPFSWFFKILTSFFEYRISATWILANISLDLLTWKQK